jgi:DNA polymerase
MATVHPSSILRAPDEESRQLEMKAFIHDLRLAAEHLNREEAGQAKPG